MVKLALVTMIALFTALSGVSAQAGELHNAAYRGDLKQIKALLARGADVKARNQSGATPLHLAADAGQTEAARLLLDHGADINAPGILGWTPLYQALQRVYTLALCKECQITPGRRTVIALLASRGASPGEQGWNIVAGYSEEAIKIIIDSLPDNAIKSLPPGWGTSFDLILRAGQGDLSAELARDIYLKLSPALRREKLRELVQTINQDSVVKYGKPLNAADRGSSPDDVMVTTLYRVSEFRRAGILLAQSLPSPPAVPETAKRRFSEGNAVFKTARNENDYREAAHLFRQASSLAPWWPNPYYNLALVQEKLANARQALQNYQFYLLAAPAADDAEKVRGKTYELEYLIKRGE